MKTIFLDGSRYASASEFHEALSRMLNLPHYYGMNADAFHDCLAERRQKVNAWVFDMGKGDVADAMRKCIAVLGDLGGQITVVGEDKEPSRDSDPADPVDPADPENSDDSDDSDDSGDSVDSDDPGDGQA